MPVRPIRPESIKNHGSWLRHRGRDIAGANRPRVETGADGVADALRVDFLVAVDEAEVSSPEPRTAVSSEKKALPPTTSALFD